jgi:hypothetical protein
LTELGLTSGEYDGDLDRLGHQAATFVNAAWWEACPDPRGLVSVAQNIANEPWKYASAKISKRKMYLCACAAGRLCTRHWQGKVGPLLDVLQRYADGAASGDELTATRDAVLGRKGGYPFGVSEYDGRPGYCSLPFWCDPSSLAELMVHYALGDRRRIRAEEQAIGPQDAAWEGITDATKAEVAAVVRDIFGNPFRSVAVDPAWLSWNDDTVSKIARSMYEEGRFDKAPVLADALEEAGCNEAALLAHCRQPGPHARGCWVVDRLLVKE